ncbi:MAG: hypothetical protein ACYDGY_03420 [Acidimicrobiales bacterium]
MIFLSPAWVEAFNDCLSGAEVDMSCDDHSLSTQAGSIRILQIVSDSPQGDLHAMLTISNAGIRMEILDEPAMAKAGAATDSSKEDVTVKVAWQDAVAMSTGGLMVAQALAAGMIKVRGNLSVLIDSYRILDSVGDRLASLHERTTYD